MIAPTPPSYFLALFVAAGLIAGGLTAESIAQEPAKPEPAKYEHGPDSQPNDAVPHGTVTQHVWPESKVFPGTKRRYSIYVPAQYDGKTPAALMVFQDGHTFEGTRGDYRVPVVFDNLIAKGDMPATITSSCLAREPMTETMVEPFSPTRCDGCGGAGRS
ncbi:hypothetical protein [Stieleria mannarensis]|uniref:hypothetical protein n=1 Tax=Stieleria mannarensis TaxID=2755585 RepID=UPI002570714E|nr:hypothetical protein [Rhodopirellula sp. JC639]